MPVADDRANVSYRRVHLTPGVELQTERRQHGNSPGRFRNQSVFPHVEYLAEDYGDGRERFGESGGTQADCNHELGFRFRNRGKYLSR